MIEESNIPAPIYDWQIFLHYNNDILTQLLRSDNFPNVSH